MQNNRNQRQIGRRIVHGVNVLGSLVVGARVSDIQNGHVTSRPLSRAEIKEFARSTAAITSEQQFRKVMAEDEVIDEAEGGDFESEA